MCVCLCVIVNLHKGKNGKRNGADLVIFYTLHRKMVAVVPESTPQHGNAICLQLLEDLTNMTTCWLSETLCSILKVSRALLGENMLLCITLLAGLLFLASENIKNPERDVVSS